MTTTIWLLRGLRLGRSDYSGLLLQSFTNRMTTAHLGYMQLFVALCICMLKYMQHMDTV